ncbi:hypothetical protein ACPUVO_17090 [Pseudocolwellia sp. HL-MZ19]|uniref:hypothetical protein n=1 Tax=Pseudocolwellia sp. HL-MZ19 TaxID=3400846 RepID=UPI003CEC99E4
MAGEVRENETRGSLDQRVFALETSNPWNTWFGKNPGTVIGIIITALFSGFWVYHTWQVERIDKNYKEQIANLQKQNKDRIEWLKEQQIQRISSVDEKCSLEQDKLNSKLLMCTDAVKKHTKFVKSDT